MGLCQQPRLRSDRVHLCLGWPGAPYLSRVFHCPIASFCRTGPTHSLHGKVGLRSFRDFYAKQARAGGELRTLHAQVCTSKRTVCFFNWGAMLGSICRSSLLLSESRPPPRPCLGGRVEILGFGLQRCPTEAPSGGSLCVSLQPTYLLLYVSCIYGYNAVGIHSRGLLRLELDFWAGKYQP